MQLLLKRSIEKLGLIGDVVNVKAGYARNYLLPNGLAVPVTKANLSMIEREREKALLEEQARLKDLKTFADKIKEASVTIEGRANQEGHLFGSVNNAQIAKAMTEKGFPIDLDPFSLLEAGTLRRFQAGLEPEGALTGRALSRTPGSSPVLLPRPIDAILEMLVVPRSIDEIEGVYAEPGRVLAAVTVLLSLGLVKLH